MAMKTYTATQVSQISAAFAHLSLWNENVSLPKNVVSKIGANVELNLAAWDADDGKRYMIVDDIFQIEVCDTPVAEKARA